MRQRPAQLEGSAPARASRHARAAGALAGTCALALFLVAACTSGSTTASSSMSAAASTAAAEPAAGDGSAAAGSSAAGSASAPASSGAAAPAAGTSAAGTSGSDPGKLAVGAAVQATNRDVIRTASVTLEIAVRSTGNTAAAKAADAASEVQAVANAAVEVRALASAPGFVGASDGGGTTMSITLRVPVNGYDSAMGELARYGTIASVKENTQDVTGQLLDIGSRMKTMAQSIDQVRILLTKATKISDIIAIESELSSREADLESLKSQQAGLADQTSLSTITVLLRGTIIGVKPIVAPAPPAPPVARSGFFGGLANGWDAVRHIGHAVLTVIGTLIPFLPVVLVIAVGVLIWRRRVRRAAGPVLGPPAVDPRPAD